MPACSSTVRARLKVLYIHPSPSSVRRAINICQSDLSSDIEEICLVNKVQWYEIRRRLRHCSECGLEYTWPSGTPKGTEDKFDLSFGEGYSELLSSLAKLTSVQALSFTDACYQPGFNMVSTQTVANWMDTVKVLPTSKERRAENKLYKSKTAITASPRFSFTDADVLQSLFQSPLGNRLRKLKLTEELPHGNRWQRCIVPSMLTHVELHVNTGWAYRNKWEELCFQVLHHSAPTLQSVNLAFQHNPSFKREHKADRSLEAVLQEIEFPALQRLELHSLEPKPGTFAPSVLMQNFDIKTFISERCSRLRQLLLVRLLPLSMTRPVRWEVFDEAMLDIEREVRAIGEPRHNIRELEIDP